MAAANEALPCFAAENWGETCKSDGEFSLRWCGKEECKNDAARRLGHWVTNGGGIACLECSKQYQTSGMLDKALRKS